MVTKGPDMRRYIMQQYPLLEKVSCRRVNKGDWFIDIMSRIVHETNEERYKFRREIYNTCEKQLTRYDEIRGFYYHCPDTKSYSVEKKELEEQQLEKKT